MAHGRTSRALLSTLVVAAALASGIAACGKKGGSPALQRAIPADSDVIGAIDLKALLQNDALKALAKARGIEGADIEKQLAAAGIKLDDIKGIMFGASSPTGGEMPSFAAAIETSLDGAAAKTALEALAKLMPDGKSQGLTTEAIEGGVVMVGRGGLFDKAVAGAKAGNNGELKPELLKMRDAVDAGATFWFATAIPKMGRRDMGMVGGMLGNVTPTHVGVSVNAGSTIDIRVAIRLEGGDASSIADRIGTLKMLAPRSELPEGMGDVLDKLEVSASGDILTAKVSVPSEVLAKLGATMR